MEENSPQATPSQAQTSEYEAIVQRLAFAAINEQRRSRRWRIFFLFLTFIYLTPLVLLMLDFNEMSLFKQDSAKGDKHTALVRLSGVIAEGGEASADMVIRGLKNAFEDDDTAGVILQVNSPGGTPVQAAQIYDEMQRLRVEHEDIPLYVVVTDVAASGGYFVATAGQNIYVNKSSLVGSIGVRLDSFGLEGLIEKMGIERRLLTAGEHKGLLDPFLPENQVERDHLQAMLDEVHVHFIDAVKQGRGERLKDNPDLFSGLVWSGEKAVELGLVDDFASSKQVARDIIKAEDLVDFTPRELFLDRLADRVGASAAKALSSTITHSLRIE
jgi:protease-4